MNNITMIAAIGKNRELGINNDLIWHCKEDLKFFKEQTMGKPMVMGYNTYYSLPGHKPLPGRDHIVLTSKEVSDYPELDYPQVKIVHTVEELLEYIESISSEVMIIGGASVYKTMLQYASKLLLTEIEEEEKNASVYFPEFNKDEYTATELCSHDEDGLVYKHLEYVKKEM